MGFGLADIVQNQNRGNVHTDFGRGMSNVLK